MKYKDNINPTFPKMTAKKITCRIGYFMLIYLFFGSAVNGQSLRFDKTQINFGEKVLLVNLGKDSVLINLDEFINLDYGRDSNMVDSIVDVVIHDNDGRSIILSAGDTLAMNVYSPGRLSLPHNGDSIILQVNPLKQVTDYADIKNIEVVEVSRLETWLKWLMVWLVLASIGLAIYKYMSQKKKKSPPPSFALEPIIPYQIVALNALKKLKSEQRYADPDTKAFQIEFTNILKIYLGHEYNLNSMEMTTDELLLKMKPLSNPEVLQTYRQFLSIADLVKFAKAKPGEEIQLETLEQAIAIINDSNNMDA